MDFKSVFDFFQGSIFSEEYIGDFTKIQQHLQLLESQAAGGSANPEQRAWVKLLNSIFSMLTGNLTKANDSLREISLIQHLPPKWLLRTAAYEAFCNSLRRYPSIVRFKPELGGPTAGLRSLELGFNEMARKYTETLQTYMNSDLPLFRFEGQVLQFMLIASLPLWNNAFIQHPSYAKGPWEALKAPAVKHMAERTKIFKAHRDTAVNLGIYQLDSYLARLELELQYGKSPKPSQMVEDLKCRYRSFGNKHNLAITKMLEADYILSPPFSNPITLNLLLIEGDQPGFSIAPWDSLEGGLKLGDTQAAGQLYREAYDLFTNSVSPRGRAAVLLRQGCVDHIQASAGNVSSEEKSRRCEAARRKFAKALHLFKLDESHSHIVRGHQILLQITSGRDDNIVQEAAEIGCWGRASSNELVSQFVGILMLRFGRRQMLDYARNDVALKCYKCAQACFRGLDDQFGLFRASNAEMYILNSMNDHLAARSMVDKQKELFRELLGYIEKLSDKHPSSKSSIFTLRQDMIIVFGDLVNSVYYNVGDTKARNNWKEELQRLRDHKGAAAIIAEAVVSTNLAKYIFRDRDSSEGSLSIFSGLPRFLVGDGDSSQGLSSMLPRLSSFLLGDRKPSQAQLSFSDYEQRSQNSVEKYYEASSRWHDALQDQDIDGAEGHLRDYVRGAAAPDNLVWQPGSLFPVFAACQLGEFERARKTLRSLLKSNFIGHDVDHTHVVEERQFQTSEEKLEKSFRLDNVLAACALAQDWDLGHRVLERIERVFPKYLDPGATDPSVELWKRLAWVGVIYEHNNAPLKAFVTFLQAFQLAEQNRSFTSDANSRRGIFSSTPFGEIFTGLARLCLRAGELGVPLAILDAYPHKHPHAKTWQEHALLFLEQAKARNLLEALTAHPSDSVEADARASRARKRRLRMALLALNKPTDADKPTHADKPTNKKGANERTIKQQEELETLEAELKDHEDELDLFNTVLPSTNSTINDEGLYRAIDKDEIVIEVDFSNHGFTLFGITSTGIEFAQQRSKLGLEIRRPVIRAIKHLANYSNPKYRTSKARVDLWGFLKEISDELILPLAHLIRRKNHVIFVASQPLTAFPFSALLIDDKPLFLRVAVSQAPSLGTLLHLWKSREASDGTIETLDTPISIYTIAKAIRIGGKREEASQETPLLLAAIEAMIIARTFNTWPVEGSKINRDTFKSLIQEGDHDGTSQGNASMRILHIGTHGHYNPRSPSLSYISLMDKFRVLDMAQSGSRRHGKMALIVFAACLSGMGQGTLGNDVLGFAHAVLETDCAAYLGALWSVDDRASMLLMTIFYQLLRDSLAGTSTAPAQVAKLWQRAQKTLYHLNIEGARKLISGFVQVLESAARDGYDPKAFVKTWKSKLDGIVEDIENGTLDLKHPFYWGAFAVVGYGGMALRKGD